MASLASEIKELHELFENGILTEKEFSEAKTAIISSRKLQSATLDILPRNEENTTVREKENLDDISKQQNKKVLWREKSHNLAFNIRLERAKASIEARGLVNFFVRCFTSDFLGDFLEGSSKSLNVLKKIILNLAENPLNEKYQQLRFSNDVVRRRIVEQTGGLEFLVQCGGELEKDENSGLYDKIYLGNLNVPNALHVLQQIKEEFDQIKKIREEERRKKAEKVLRATLLRNTRQLQRNVEQKNSEAESHLKRPKGEREEQECNDQRVPIDKALLYLTKSGRKTM